MITLRPSLNEFRDLAAGGDLIPVAAEIVSDTETPIGVFEKIADQRPCFLFESAERNEESGRFSFIGFDPLMVISSRAGKVTIRRDEVEDKSTLTSDPLGELQKVLATFRFLPRPDVPHFHGGAVGFMGYDMVRFFEPKVPLHPVDDMSSPEMMFVIARTLVVFDHRFRKVRVIALADLHRDKAETAYAQAQAQIEGTMKRLSGSSRLEPLAVPQIAAQVPLTSNTTDFEHMVGRAKKYIAEGDIFQVVLSQRFEAAYSAEPLEIYRRLRFMNPSPYMFFLNFGDEFRALGSSPELHVRVRNRIAEMRPIAGTRPRGGNPARDEANAGELLADPKERAEHVMLVDLARNDLGRVAQFGSVHMTEQMTIERYSHVMHIVSQVRAQLRSGLNAFDVFRATFPAGTVSGAPKVRAMQIISELEKARRGFYAGTVGWFDFDGNCDSCISLRSVVLSQGKAFVQAGAGIVADSFPTREREECENKAMAVLLAIASGERKCCS